MQYGEGFNFKRNPDGTLVHVPSLGGVKIGKNAEVYDLTNVVRGTEAGSNTEIGEGTKIDVLCHIAHDVKIGKHCLLPAGVIVGGRCEIGDYSFIGINTCIRPRVKIGKNVMIGAGSVVVCDVPDGEIWMGNPAKFYKKNEVIY